ncbi:sigma-70 family RNA polymerase sigma factor [Verrucomicrobiales bacterium]|nr:sigma-70 family RNA polymerase sigma factor [Verrucomicrobiales bacterium]
MTEITAESLIQESDKLYAYALKHVGKHHHAQDLVQESLLVGWRKRDSFDGRSTLSTWLFGIMKFKILDHHRLAKRTPTESAASGYVDADGAETDPLDNLFTSSGAWRIDPNYGMGFLDESPDETVHHSEIMEWVRRCMERLPERMRLLFQLRDIDELPVPEAAVAAGVTAGSAAVILTRARHQLRTCLQQNQVSP